MFYSDSQQLITLAFNVKENFLSSPLLHRQKEDEVERQHLGSILVRNHHVDGGIPQATHLFGGTVTVHDIHLIVNSLILLIVDADRTPPMAGEDHAPPTTDGDHTHPMIDAGHTRLTTAAGTVQGLHIATGDVGHLPMTDPVDILVPAKKRPC
jgi:hypothetical protein